MKKYIYVGIGGFLGALSRHLVKCVHTIGSYHHIPLHTLAINLSGSFLLALILTFALETREINAEVKLGITTGFLGAYTTFSALCKETVDLMQTGHDFAAFAYIIGSIVLGLGMAYFGMVSAHKIGCKLQKEHKRQNSEVDRGEK